MISSMKFYLNTNSKVDFITEPGEFSVRGGIVDVFVFE
jgi:transcription-repair coupling factor (superfamily II helicase)